ncbi:MAG: carboxypeptidase regulatory-like domain-containing protein, partial [Bacteroidota bacterium]
ESYTVTFIVTNIDSGSPIPEAIIEIDGSEITTNNDGEAAIDLTDGTYSYTVTAEYYQDATGSVTVEGSDVTEEVEMEQELWNYSFMVSNAVTGEPIEGAIIEVQDETATTDESGQASVLLPAGGGQDFYVEADGYEPASGTTASEPFFIHEVGMMPLSGEVLFNVYNEETEEPIEGAEIDIEDQDVLFTDENGQAETTLYYGEYSAEVSADGFDPASETFEVNSANLTVDFGLLLETGIDELEDDISLTIYPNPASTKVTLVWNTPQNIEQVSVKTVNGHSVKTFTKLSGKTQELDLSGLSAGVYFLSIESQNENYQRKVIIK